MFFWCMLKDLVQKQQEDLAMAKNQMVRAADGLIDAFRTWRRTGLILTPTARKLSQAIDRWEAAYALELEAKFKRTQAQLRALRNVQGKPKQAVKRHSRPVRKPAPKKPSQPSVT